ncbi:hypothetical protein CAI21_08185 [Alkalilimnicola ehrlichii]|uniref:ABC-2 type transporter transmembrane domain-containing protein n=1 Tax=Alkalilimnicola ehrlichii TaxID=351052 RepID=A0A3E0WZB6_9GAMM|nr:ABC transporter permease [Alkalilimnicola ehrlichii]RFA30155.1 hypothetical protein CAI21_08185 [Alkalilimnicola ehrlichii]RFA37503.1 hypothetical protein CAL65_09530 [Alkalilimnicola ehrlichii]
MQQPGFFAVVAREWRHLLRDRSDAFFVFGLPLLLGLLLVWTFASATPRGLPVLVLDQDGSHESRQLTRLIDAAPGVSVAQRTPIAGQAWEALETRQVYGVVHIPRGFTDELVAGRRPTVQFQHNAQYATHSAQLRRDVQMAVATFSTAVELTAEQRQGRPNPYALDAAQPIPVASETLFNESLDYQRFLAAALWPAVLQMVLMITAVAAVGRELRDGTAQRWLDVAGGGVTTAVVAKLLPYAVFYFVLSVGMLLWLSLGRSIPVAGSVWVLVVGLALLVAAGLSLGLLAVALVRNYRMALSVTAFYTAPAFAFAGHAFPLASMPVGAQVWAALLPLTYWLPLQNQQWLAGAPASYALGLLGALALYVLIPLVLGLLLLRRRGFSPEAWGAR